MLFKYIFEHTTSTKHINKYYIPDILILVWIFFSAYLYNDINNVYEEDPNKDQNVWNIIFINKHEKIQQDLVYYL